MVLVAKTDTSSMISGRSWRGKYREQTCSISAMVYSRGLRALMRRSSSLMFTHLSLIILNQLCPSQRWLRWIERYLRWGVARVPIESKSVAGEHATELPMRNVFCRMKIGKAAALTCLLTARIAGAGMTPKFALLYATKPSIGISGVKWKKSPGGIVRQNAYARLWISSGSDRKGNGLSPRCEVGAAAGSKELSGSSEVSDAVSGSPIQSSSCSMLVVRSALAQIYDRYCAADV